MLYAVLVYYLQRFVASHDTFISCSIFPTDCVTMRNVSVLSFASLCFFRVTSVYIKKYLWISMQREKYVQKKYCHIKLLNCLALPVVLDLYVPVLFRAKSFCIQHIQFKHVLL
jgi:hypothetical protein